MYVCIKPLKIPDIKISGIYFWVFICYNQIKRLIIMELDFEKIKKYNNEYKGWLKQFPNQCYAYENNACTYFAHLLALSAQKNGYQNKKIYTCSSNREKQGVSTFLPQDNNGEFKKVWWEFHMACAIDVPIYKDSPKTETLVADPILFGDNLVTLKQWCSALDCNVEYLSVIETSKDKNVEQKSIEMITTLNDYIQKQQNLHNVAPQKNSPVRKYSPLKSTLVGGINKSCNSTLIKNNLPRTI